MSVRNPKSKKVASEKSEQDRMEVIFNNLPIAVWEEDFSALLELKDILLQKKVRNIRAFLLKNRDLVERTLKRIKILNVNQAVLDLYQAESKKELLGNLDKTMHCETMQVIIDEFASLLSGKVYFESELKTRTIKGKVLDLIIKLQVPQAYSETFEKVIVTMQDITSQKRTENSLRRMAQTDGLTGVYNHSIILKRLKEEFKRAVRYENHLSCLMIDLDHFKGINDLCGHQKGDKVLRKTAQKIKDYVREVDIVGRYGGDEFIVILPETPVERAGVVADRLIKIFDELASSTDKRVVFSTVSVGIGGIPTDGIENAKALLSEVDKAMYKAKKAGRNTSAIVNM